MALFGNLAPLNSLLHQHFPIFRQSHLSSLVDDSRELYYPIYWGWRIRHGGAEENQRVERDDVAAIERCSLVHRVKIPSNYRHTDYRYIHCTAQFFFARQQGFTPLQQANEQIKIESLFSKRASKEKINQDLLMQVMEMGFSELRSEKAAKWLEPMAKKCS